MTRHIAFISEHASPVALLGGVDAGGQNVYVDAVSRGLAAHGYEVDVFTVRLDLSQPEVIQWADGVRVVNVQTSAGPHAAKDALWPHMPEFRDGIDRFTQRQGQRYDLIHGNFWMSGWVAADLARRWGVPFVQIFHATGATKRHEQGAADTSPSERIEIEKDIVHAADRLIAQCPVERDELLQDYAAPASRIALIPSAVDVDRFHPVDHATARKILGLDPSAQLITYIGRIVPRKDVRNVVRALACLKLRRLGSDDARMPTLLVVGGETERPDPDATPEIAVLQELARELGVSNHVEFVGRKQPDQLHLWYSAADVAVTTPWYEPFGLTPLEAMACATPVIGSRVGGIAFTIADGESGFLVAPRDPGALGARLETLLRDAALRARMGRAGRARVLRFFTWQTVAERTAELYATLLSDDAAEPALARRAVRDAAGTGRSQGVSV